LHAVLEQLPRLPRPVGRGRRRGLDADHLEPRPGRLPRDARAGGAAPAADRHDHDVDVGLGFEQLEGRRPDACDQVRLVAGVDVAIPVLTRERLAVLARLVEVAAVDDELGAEPLHRRELDGVGASMTWLIPTSLVTPRA